MKNQFHEFILDSKESDVFENNFFQNNLQGKTFRGFWYDHDEESYGIVLTFGKDAGSKLSLFAQDALGGASMMEYKIESHSYLLEQIANDKVLICLNSYRSQRTVKSEHALHLPGNIEFTLHMLSENSSYIQFHNHKLFSPPISKLGFGLVLAIE